MTLAPGNLDSQVGFYYKSFFQSQTKTESRKNTRGRKPCVDFTMSGIVDQDVVYVIPVEAKKKLCKANMAQLAQYMTTLVNGQYIRGYATLGMLVDDTSVRFAFSVLCAEDDSSTPLPVIFVSPPVKWRNGVLLSRAVCVGMCLLQNLKLQRMRAGEMWAKYLGHETWHTIREVALQVKEEKFVLPKGVDAAQGDLLQVVETMHELMQEKFEAMQECILVLEKALAEQTPSVSPTLPFKRSRVEQ